MKEYFNNYFSSIDLHFGNFIASFAKKNNDDIFLAAALVSRYLRDGHICLDLKTIAGNILFKSEDGKDIIECPKLDSWLTSLTDTLCVGAPGDFKPLILDNQARLYLQRYWQYQKDVAEYILSKVSCPDELNLEKVELQKKLNLYFRDDCEKDINWQKVAAVAALIKKFLIISGSPGTGKTTTITKIMAFVLDVENRNIRIALAAPTGKAAARLQESVKKTKEKLNCAEAIKEMIPDEAKTIHRLLGSMANSSYFQFNEKNTLPYDLVVIDEASMIDLPLLAKLMAALPPHASLILIGDKDQLASVDAGAVLGDICGNFSSNIFSPEFARQIEDLSGQKIPSGNIPPSVQDSIIQLQQNYRFSNISGIGLLSQAIKEGKEQEVLELLYSGKYADIHWTEIAESEKSFKELRQIIIEKYRDYLNAANSGSVSADQIFDLFERFRILCALRVGNWGTERINAYIEKILADAGLINPRSLYYEGRPIMVLHNDYNLRLFNGDVGIVLKDKNNDDQLRVFFRDEQGCMRKILPARLPGHETVWAMTVHKSQGSEFEEVILILSERDMSVITRELVYTGITRASGYVNILTSKEILSKAISRRIYRQSGLTDALQNQIDQTII